MTQQTSIPQLLLDAHVWDATVNSAVAQVEMGTIAERTQIATYGCLLEAGVRPSRHATVQFYAAMRDTGVTRDWTSQLEEWPDRRAKLEDEIALAVYRRTQRGGRG
jgi:hypothetical protein